MLELIDKLYINIRKEEIRKASKRLKDIKISTIYEIISKCCWSYGIQYDIIYKNIYMLVINLKGSKESVIIKFHKTNIVYNDDYEKFIYLLKVYKPTKGIYITTGNFDSKILISKQDNKYTNILKLENGHQFIKKQLGLSRKTELLENTGYLLYNYFPC